MTPEQLDYLEACARRATAGPWEIVRMREGTCTECTRGVLMGGWETEDGIEQRHHILADGEALRDGDRDFIAAANPAVVLALVDEIRRLRAGQNAAQAERQRVGRELDALAKGLRGIPGAGLLPFALSDIASRLMAGLPVATAAPSSSRSPRAGSPQLPMRGGWRSTAGPWRTPSARLRGWLVR